MTDKTVSLLSIARMATDSLARLNRIDEKVAQYRVGLITETELQQWLIG